MRNEYSLPRLMVLALRGLIDLGTARAELSRIRPRNVLERNRSVAKLPPARLDAVQIARRCDEAAFVIGHELAHNILRHRALLDKLGRSPENYRQTERAADRLGLWLMANAGYDTSAASAFMQRWARRRGPILFPESTHDGWKTRQRTIAEVRTAADDNARRLTGGMGIDDGEA